MRVLPGIGVAAVLSVLAGCHVQVHKDDSGKNKDVSVNVPFGHVEVRNGEKADAVGLPLYPGAVPASSKDNDQSGVNVDLGFGDWKLQVNAANYVTPDSQDKVEAYYRAALARYGDVLLCRGDAPVGTPTRTAEGLSCEDDNQNSHVPSFHSKDDLMLKAGSPRKQHLVGFEKRNVPGTHFALVALVLPPHNTVGGDTGVE